MLESNLGNRFVFNRTKLSLAFIFIATGIRSFWGLFFMCPTFIKIIFVGLIYLSLLIFPYNSLKQSKRDFNKAGQFILVLLLILILIAVFHGCLDDGSAITGNKYVSLFFNEYTLLLFFPPIFSYLAVKEELWQYVKEIYVIYLIYSVLCLMIFKFDPIIMSVFLVPIFLPYFHKFKKILVYINIFAVLYVGLIVGDRKFIVLLFFSLLAYFSYVNNFFRRFVKYISIFSVLIPIGFLVYALSTGDSPFEMANDLNIKNSFNNSKDLTADSRTFLYTELASDLSETNSWMFGKGPIGSYYSTFMENISMDRNADWGDSSNRIQNEVTFLSYLLKGGLVYAFCCFLILVIAILNAAFRGKNKFVKSLAVILSGIYVNSFMGDMAGCSLLQILIWLIIGTCLSSKWINYTDEEILEKLKIN